MVIQRTILIILVLINGIMNTQAQDEGNSEPSKFMASMFRKKTIEWQEAFNSRNASSLAQFYTEDARYISSDSPGLCTEGREKITANLGKLMNSGSHMDSIEILSLNISDDLATVYCRYRMTRGSVTRSGQNIMVLRRSGIKWHIFLHMVVE